MTCAAQTGTERPPARRTLRMGLLALTVTMSFGLATTYTYESLRDPDL